MNTRGTTAFVVASVLAGLAASHLARTRPALPGMNVRAQAGGSEPRQRSSEPATRARLNVEKNYGKLPLTFEANQGQTDKSVQFFTRGRGYSLFLTPTESVLTLRGPAAAVGPDPKTSRTPGRAEFAPASRSAVLRMKLLGSNPRAAAAALEELPSKSNYFIGNDPKQWRTNVPNYGKVRFTGVYPGVDLVYYGNQRQLEYDFVVAPGANPSTITLGFEGAERMQIDSQGELTLWTPMGEVRWHEPVLYQKKGGVRHAVGGHYVGKGKNAVGFAIASYDPRLPLIIDPVLVYSTYLGTSGGSFDGNEAGFGIAVDSSGNAYVAGETVSAGFPTTAGAFQASFQGFFDGFVTKLNTAGTAMVYSTYLGGSNQDGARSIAVDPAGNAYITGFTRSSNFPTINAFQAALNGGQNAFVTELNAAGNALVYSTYLGGSGSFFELGLGIAVDSSGNAYVTGATRSPTFPTRNAFQSALKGPQDAFIARLDTSTSGGDSLVYSTYLGGSSTAFASDQPGSIAADSFGNAYVIGSTDSADFPATTGAFQSSLGIREAAYVTKVDTNASGVASLVYSTFLGGSAETEGHGIAIDLGGHAYVTGYTADRDFPTTAGAFQTAHAGGNGLKDAFVAKLNATGSGLVYSTYLGGGGDEVGFGIALDSSGNAYVTGTTSSPDFPAVNAIQAVLAGGFCCYNAFVTRLNPVGSSLLYSTYLGGSNGLPYSSVAFDEGFGIAVDACGKASITGLTQSSDFPTVNAIQPMRLGSQDAFVAKIGETGPAALTSISVTPANPILARSATQQFTATGILSDCSTQDLTSSVTWGSSTPSVATITAGGLASGIGTGTSLITASSGSVSGSTTLAVVTPIDLSLSLSSTHLDLTASQTAESEITLESLNGVSEEVELDWSGAVPTGVTVSISPDRLVVRPSQVSATLTVTAPPSPPTGPFTLTITGTSASGVTRSQSLTVVITGSLPPAAPACDCTRTGPFVSPSVMGLVQPDAITGEGPNGLAQVSVDSNTLTLTRSDGKVIVDHRSTSDLSDWGFSPSGTSFVVITKPGAPGILGVGVDLYSVPLGRLLGTGSPLVDDVLNWGFSPDDDSRYFLVASSPDVLTQIDISVYDTQTGAVVARPSVFGYSSFGPPPWSDKNASKPNNKAGGWGFSPDGNTFVLSYKTDENHYSLSLWNLTRNTPTRPIVDDSFLTDVAAFWEFSPCGDLFMWVHQQGANAATTDPVSFLFTSDGSLYDQSAQITLEPSQVPTATVVANSDGSSDIHLTGMSLSSIPSPTCSVLVGMHSPANIVVTDETGHRTGFDPATGGFVTEIPGSSYTGVGSEPQTVRLRYVPGAYIVDAFGLDSLTSPQPYTLTFEAAGGSGEVFDRTALTGMASRGTHDRYAFTVGNGPIEPTRMDVTPPEIQCGAPDGQWHASDVTLACAASDSESGLANPADASFSLSTHVAAGVETGDASTDSRQVCDTAGNCAVAGPIAGNQVDRKPPSIGIAAPAGTYLLGQIVAADYSCADGGSGVESCSGTVSNGATIDTATVGAHALTVSSVDRVGNGSSSVASYTVAYNICPLYDPSTAKKSGSAYPIKLQLCDAAGSNVSSSSIVVHAVGVTLVSSSTPMTLDDTGNANPDFDFRYDSSLGGYIFNLSTNGYGTGTYSLNFIAGADPAVHSVQFAVR